MEIRDQIMADVKAAMIAKESIKLTALRMLQAAIKNREIELRPDPINKDEVMGVIKKLVKQRKESIEQFQQAGRQDLVDQETTELKVLEVYLPQAMPREQVEAVVMEVIAALGAKSVKDMGPVMKEVVARTAGAADNKMVSEIIKAKLA
jgi:uncharacterized protein YqeY